MLNRDEIQARLGKGEIFRSGTWNESSLHGASYDLRIADDFLIAGGKRYGQGKTVSEITIQSGETALVSTAERFGLPWDLVGNMSPKFSLAKKGLLIHTGSIVDPGFGLRKNGAAWTPDPDERVHFFLVNVGAKPITLRPGDPIATLQFATILPPKVKIEPRSSRLKVAKQFFDPDLDENIHKELSLAFFGLLKESQHETERRDQQLESRITKLEGELRAALAGYQQITFFGVYVLGAALLTIFGTILLGGSLGGVFDADKPDWLQMTVATGMLLIVLVPVLIIALMKGVRGKEKASQCRCRRRRWR